MRQFAQLLLTLLISMLTQSNALAQEDEPISDSSSAAKEKTLLWLDVGTKLSVGGNYLAAPDNYPGGILPFKDGAAGVAGGGGFFVEGRILNGHLGLEWGLQFERNRDWCNIERDGWQDYYFTLRFINMRMPLMVKAILTKGSPRFSLGFGPEFVIGLNASGDIKVDGGGAGSFTALKQNDVFLAFDLGWAIEFHPWILTLDLKFAYNVTQKKNTQNVLSPQAGLPVR